MGSAKATVEGIVPSVSFSPNGSTEWKKQHTTKVTVEETAETITEMKYLWVKDDRVNEPDISEFTQNCPSDGVITGGDDTMTGTYYLWIILTIGTEENQKTSICVSQGFNFDNEGPTVTLDSTSASETSFTLTATASDNKSGIAKYEFYIDGVKYEPDSIEGETATYTWNGTEMVENKECYVIVYDKLNNYTRREIKARTLLYSWKRYERVLEYSYKKGDYIKIESNKSVGTSGLWANYNRNEPNFDSKTGNFIWSSSSTGTGLYNMMVNPENNGKFACGTCYEGGAKNCLKYVKLSNGTRYLRYDLYESRVEETIIGDSKGDYIDLVYSTKKEGIYELGKDEDYYYEYNEIA